jgi:hypothetical protein
MNNMKRIGLMTAILLTVVLSGSAVEAGIIRFSGPMEGNESTNFFPNPPPCGFFINGQATATLGSLGQFTMFYTQIVELVCGQFQSIGPGVGAVRFIDAYGNEIYASEFGQDSDCVPPDMCCRHIMERGLITGGTGRYANAKGSFTVDRETSPCNGDTSGTITGSIVIRGQ